MHDIQGIGRWGWFLVALGLSAFSIQAQPAWWAERQVLVPGATADDYAVANIGQLKYIAAKAALEMDAKLPGGAGMAIDDLILGWQNPPVGAPPVDDYAVLNQGQLKYVAKLFYDRLSLVDYSGPPLSGGALYPWTHGPGQESDDDAYAAVNLGQLKYVFSFVVPGGSSGGDDTDLDGLADAWELQYWGNLSQAASDDPDGDGVDNLTEYLQGRNPTKGAVSDASVVVGLSVYSPTP